jgi:hypothetical protein
MTNSHPQGLSSGEPDRPMVHFVATSKLLSLQRQNASFWNMSTSTTTLYRIVAECVIYNIACLALFYPDLEFLSQFISWQDIESFFPKISSYRTSPFLGGRRDVYYLMFDVTRIARQDLSPEQRRRQVSRFTKRLSNIEDGVMSYYSDDVPTKVADLYGTKYKLHVLALRIFIAKLEDPTRCATSPEIAIVFQQSLILLQTKEIIEDLNPAMCWPLIIFACAAATPDDFETLKDCAHKYLQYVDRGHVERLEKAYKKVTTLKRRSDGVCGRLEGGVCTEEHDGLQLLLRAGLAE